MISTDLAVLLTAICGEVLVIALFEHIEAGPGSAFLVSAGVSVAAMPALRPRQLSSSHHRCAFSAWAGLGAALTALMAGALLGRSPSPMPVTWFGLMIAAVAWQRD